MGDTPYGRFPVRFPAYLSHRVAPLATGRQSRAADHPVAAARTLIASCPFCLGRVPSRLKIARSSSSLHFMGGWWFVGGTVSVWREAFDLPIEPGLEALK